MIVVAAVALVLSTTLIGYAMRDGISYFRSPSEVAAEKPAPGEVFKIGGLVKDGTIEDLGGVSFAFVVTDGGAEIPVRYVGNDPRPDLFAEGQGTIATGKYIDGEFQATDILAKHDETYMPREVVDSLKEQGVYRDPNG